MRNHGNKKLGFRHLSWEKLTRMHVILDSINRGWRNAGLGFRARDNGDHVPD